MPLADQSVQCCVTSPPYWGLRDYGLEPTEWPAVEYAPMAGLPNVVVESWRGCLGLEPTPEMFVGHLVAVFREVRRVLRNDGVAWVNLGDSYSSNQKGTGGDGSKSGLRRDGRSEESRIASAKLSISHQSFGAHNMDTGLKPKDLVGIPWRVAFALQADGWWLRSDVIWHKPNPMPESVTDRPTKSHEYVFLMTKSARYFYDADAVREDISDPSPRESGKKGRVKGTDGISQPDWLNNPDRYDPISGRNRRTVWTIPTAPYSGAHFATYPPALVEPCIKAGSREGDVVFDPFVGSGTTLMVARQLGRHGVGLDLSAEYLGLARERLELDKLEAWESGRTDPGNGQPELTDLPLFKEAP